MEQYFPTFSTVFILLFIFGGIAWIVQTAEKETAVKTKRLQKALAAQATVVQVGQSRNTQGQGAIWVRLCLEVAPPSGAPYQVTVPWEVQPTAISQIQAGKKVSVKIDRENPKIIYPRVNWAEFSWLSAHLLDSEEEKNE